MRYIYLILILLTVFSGFSQNFETIKIIDNGPDDKRIVLAVLGDGYTVSDQNSFLIDAQNLIDYLFTVPPFKEYKKYFNVYAIKVISEESGVKHPGTATDVTEPVFPVSNPNNYLSSSFDVNVHRCVYGNTQAVSEVLANSLPNYDNAFILVNSEEYGGCGGQFAFFTTNKNANEILVHELGHTFSGLADEYWFSGSRESPNKTQNFNALTNKWKNWIGENGIDIYPHEESPTWYRPHQACRMRALGNDFCSVCKEATVERIHALQGPIENYDPQDIKVDAEKPELSFSVNLIVPEPNTLAFNWRLNQTTINDHETNITINSNDLIEGINTLTFTITDNTDFVRTENHSLIHFEVVTWEITKQSTLSTEITSKKAKFTIYPVPASDFVYVKSHNKGTNLLEFEIIDLFGRSILKKQVEKDTQNVFSFDISKLPASTYLLRIYSNNTIIHTQKIIKE